MMNLSERVDAVVAMAGDSEAAHSAEDSLMVEWIAEHATLDELEEFRRMWLADFPRWCA